MSEEPHKTNGGAPPTFDFSACDPSKRTTEYVFYRLDVDGHLPSVTVRYAGRGNAAYQSACMKRIRTSKKLRTVALKQRVSSETVDAMTEDMIPVYAKTVIADWDVKIGGEPVPLNYENALRFLSSIPTNEFVDLQRFCENPRNFREEVDDEEMDEIDIEDLLGNS